MIWLPLLLLCLALILAVTRSVTGAVAGRGSLAVGLLLAGSAVWLVGAIFLTVDLLALAADVKAGALAAAATHPRLLTATLAVLGLALGFGGMGRAAGRALEADPQGPQVSLTAPILAAGLGFVLVLTALMRV